MHRLVLLFIALFLGIWALTITRSAEPTAAVALRDGLLLIIMSAMLFAAVAFPPLRRFRREPGPSAPLLLRLFIALGISLVLAGGALSAYALYTATLGDLLPWFLLTWAAGALILGLSALWPNRAKISPVWSVAAARSFLERTPEAPGQNEAPAWLGRRSLLFFVLVITAVAALVRLWFLDALPAGCSPTGCAAAIHALEVLRQGDWQALLLQGPPLYTALVAVIFGLFGPGLDILQWVGLILGVAAAPLLFLAASRLVIPGVALVGTLLLIFSPWHIELSRYPEPGTLLLPLLLGALWVRWWAMDHGGSQRWTLAGFAAGLTTLAAPLPVAVGLFVWLLFVPPMSSWRMRLLYWTAVLAAASPRISSIILFIINPEWSGAVSENLQFLRALVVEGAPLVNGIFGLLALFGLAYMLRFLRWSAAALILSGTVLLAIVTLTAATPPDLSTWTPLFTLFTLTAVIALDQLVGRSIHFWSPLLRPTLSLAVATGLILIVLVADAQANVDGWATAPDRVARHANVEQGVGRYLNSAFQSSVDNGGEDPNVTFVPMEVLNHPATQLAAGGVLPFARRTVALDAVEHLPFVGTPFTTLPTDGDLRYIVPAGNLALLHQLDRIYPDTQTEIIQGEGGRVLAYAVSVSQAEVDTIRGLPTFYYAGEEAGTADTALRVEKSGPLDFAWEDGDALAAPFTLVAEGLLYAPEAGFYRFEAEHNVDGSVRMELGSDVQNWEILNSADEMLTGAIELRQGYYPLRITYSSGADLASLSIRWQRPLGKWEPIPRQALFDLPVDSGLLATYYAAGSELMDLESTTPMAQRREPILLANPLLAESALVIWESKLAAPVEGTYQFSIEGRGRYQLWIDGSLVLNENRPVQRRNSAEIYLGRDWHDLNLRYLPAAGDPRFQLSWQPPGGEMQRIDAQYFAPYEPDIDASALALPEAPALVVASPPAGSLPADAAAAPGQFQISAIARPVDLPEIPMQALWQGGSCGAEETQFQQPRGALLIPEQNRLYVADAGNQRLVAYDLESGEPQQIYTDERLSEPFDLGRTATGELYLLDAVAHQIFRLDLENERLEALPLETSFYRPRGLGVDTGGALLVADTGGARVVVLSADGRVLTQIGGPDTEFGRGQPVDVISLPNGSIWAVTAEDGFLWRLDIGEGRAATAPSDTFSAPHFAGLPDSSFFLTDPVRRLILYYDATGQAVAQFSSGGFAAPVGIDAAVIDDHLLVAITDSAACTLSLWHLPVDEVP